jgi:hypothetical protein
MPALNKKHFVRIVLAAWVFIWVWFAVRAYFRYNLLNQYIAFISLPSLEEKRALVTNKELYEFLKFCKDSIPPHSTYKFISGKSDRWAVYYLYPNIVDPSPTFLLIYKIENFNKEGYCMFKALAHDKYILIKAAQ